MAVSTTRKRDIAFPFGGGRIDAVDVDVTGGPTFKSTTGWKQWGTVKGTQVTVSEGHPFHSRSTGDVGDIGGEFYTEKRYIDGVPNHHATMSVAKQVGQYIRNRLYVGPIYATNPFNKLFPPSIDSPNGQLDALGATAIARCKPTNSVADASVFLGELLKDGAPRVAASRHWKEKTKRAKAAGDDFLNVEFGWLPLISDVRKLAYAATHSDAVISQYERDAGKVVRRRYNFPVQAESSQARWATGVSPYFDPDDSTFYEGLRGNVVRKVETSRRQWFSGAFTYHMPSGYDSRSAMSRAALEAKKLYGLSLSPETLWNLTPWSWAVDWFTNTGDVVSNISDWAIDGLVMRYGYMMEHTISKHTYIYEPPTGLLDQDVIIRPLTFVTETKKRRKANPFGFGITWDGLSPLQIAIAAALGLSRS